MPRIFAIDWDRHEVRGLLVQSGPTGITIAGAWAAALDGVDGTSANAQQVGARLATAMGSRTVGKATVIIGVGRDHVQMKLLSLPPAPADELPEMVRFQAEREFTALGSAAALDFIPLTGDAQTPHQVLAVALSPTGMAEAREICQLLDVEPNRVVLRACAAATLVHRVGVVPVDSVALVVNPLTDEADLTVLADGLVILTRTLRLPEPAQAEARQRALAAEIRRTVAAVRQQLGDRQVGRVLVCGNAASIDQAASLSGELEMRVEKFDPAGHAPAGLTAQQVPAESLARFAAVLGMALGEADRRPPSVDFVHVRRRAAARQLGRLHLLAAAAAALILLSIGFQMWRRAVEPTRELARIESEIASLQPLVKQAEAMTAKAAAVDRWLSTDVTWLDGLAQLSERLRPKPLDDKKFPADDDVVVSRLTIFRPPPSDLSAGRIDMRAVAKSDAAVAALEARTRDSHHDVRAGIVRQHTGTPGYEREFDLYVAVAPAADEPAETAR